MDSPVLGALAGESLAGGSLALPADALGSPTAASLVRALFPDGVLRLDAVEVLPGRGDGTTRVRGTIPGEALGIAHPTALVEISSTPAGTRLRVTLTAFPAGWRASTTFPSLAGTLVDDLVVHDPSLLLDSAPPPSAVPGPPQGATVTLRGGLELAGPLAAVGALFEGATTMALRADVPVSAPRTARFEATLGQPSGKSAVAFSGLSVVIDAAQGTAVLRGGTTLRMGGDVLDLSLAGAVDATGALTAALSLRSPGGWHEPFGIRGVTIDGLGGSLGVQEDGFTIGLEGIVAVGGADDGLELDVGAKVLDGEVPAALVASVRAAPGGGVTLGRMVRGFTGIDASRVPLLEQVALRDLSLYLVADPNGFPSPVDPTVVYRGMSARADAVAFGIEAGADVELGWTSGAVVRGSVARPIELAGGIRIADATGTVGPSLVVDTRPETLAAGGDYLRLSALAKVFEAQAAVYAVVRGASFRFDLDFHLPGFDAFALRCAIPAPDAFSADANVAFGVGGRSVHLAAAGVDIGTLALRARVTAALAVQASPSTFRAALDATLLLGNDLPAIALHLTTDDPLRGIADLVELVGGEVERRGWELVRQAISEPGTLFRVAREGLVSLRAEPGQLLRQVFGTPEEEAATVLRAAGYAADAVADALKKGCRTAGERVAKLLRNEGFGVIDVARALRTVFGWGAEAVATALQGAGYGASEIASALKEVFGWGADKIADYLQKGLGFGKDVVEGALSAAGFARDEVAKLFRSGWDKVTGWF